MHEQKSNYLITGYNGYLGKVLVLFLKRTANVYTLGRAADSDFSNDITTAFKLNTTVKFDVVIHAAGKAHSSPRTEAEISEFFDVNLEGTKNLCDALIRSGNIPQSFVFISTVSVYGRDEGYMIKEQHELKGTTPYAKSKILAEEWLQIWANMNNVILTILRLPLIAGPNPPGNLGAMISGIKHGKYLSIGKASARKSMVWAPDIATIIPTAALTGGVFNLTDGYHPSLREIEACISLALQKKTPHSIPSNIAKILGYAGDIIGKRFPVNSDKIKKLTDTLTFDDSLAVNMLNWKPSPVLKKLASVI